MSIVTRFAPSPTGYLHLGHAFSALFAWRRARAAGGRFLLRLEDIDPGRCRPDYAAAIVEDLTWLGLNWDGEVRAQSQHFAAYAAVLSALRARGLVYPCFCSRADIAREIAASAAAPHAPDGSPVYPGTCRAVPPAEAAGRIKAGEPHAMRLDMRAALAAAGSTPTFVEEPGRIVRCDPGRFGDVVLGRRDAPASYHLCVTHDDALQGVTLVTRGRDLFDATDVHRLIQTLMGWPAPRYAHHRLLTDPSGRRLAKRDRAATLRDLRAAGAAPSDALTLIAESGGMVGGDPAAS